MSATVGGRLEPVERPRSLFGPDYLRLAALALVAVAVHGWLLAHTTLTARDSLGFARQALCFEHPSFAPPDEKTGRAKNTLDHIRSAEHPPGYALAVWATDAVLGAVSSRPVADRVLLAAQLANAIATVLLVVPTYLIGRMLFSRNVGFAAALLFQVLPVPVRITSDGLTEGVYLLATGVAIMLSVRAARLPRVSTFLLCGLAIGASYLVRPEGLMVAAGPGAVALWMGLTRRWPRDAALGRLTALLVGVALVSVPYMILIGKITNKPTATYMIPMGPSRPLFKGGPEDAPPEGAQRAVTGSALFAAWWNHERDAGKSRIVWSFQAVFQETSKSANYVMWPLALFSVLALRRKFATEPGLWVVSVVVACNFALLVCVARMAGYISERHTMLLTMLACQLAAGGLPLLAAAIGQLLPQIDRLGVRVTAASLLVGLVASALPFALKPMHPQREGHRRAGEWIAARITDEDAMVDPYCWAEWYAGRTLYRTSKNPEQSKNNYVVLENEDVKGSAHSRLPLLSVAKRLRDDPAGNPRAVYWWPENVLKEESTVIVYQLGNHPNRLGEKR